MKKKRKRSDIRKAREIILKTADQLEKIGIDCSKRGIYVGGNRPKQVQALRDEKKPPRRDYD